MTIDHAEDIFQMVQVSRSRSIRKPRNQRKSVLEFMMLMLVLDESSVFCVER